MVDDYIKLLAWRSIPAFPRPGRPGEHQIVPRDRFFVLVLVAGVAVTGLAATDDQAKLDQLDRLLAAGQAQEVVRLAAGYLDTGGLDPRNLWRFRQRLGVGLLASGEAAAAVPILERALAESPAEPALHQNLGRALRQTGQRGRAVAEFQMAVNLAPDRYTWRLEYAEALLDLGIRREALAEVNAARRLCNDCPEALRGAVNFHLATDDVAAAIEPLRQLQAVAPTSQYRLLLVQALWAAAEAEAVADLLDPVPEEQLSGEELAILIEVDRRLGRSDRARRWVTSGTGAVERVAYPPHHVWAVLAEICLADGQAESALVAIDRALADLALVDPTKAALYHHNRAAILVALDRQDEARGELEEARRLDPGLGKSP